MTYSNCIFTKLFTWEIVRILHRGITAERLCDVGYPRKLYNWYYKVGIAFCKREKLKHYYFRTYHYFPCSMLSSRKFKTLVRGSCTRNTCSPVGLDTFTFPSRGKFYVVTNASTPYCSEYRYLLLIRIYCLTFESAYQEVLESTDFS